MSTVLTFLWFHTIAGDKAHQLTLVSRAPPARDSVSRQNPAKNYHKKHNRNDEFSLVPPLKTHQVQSVRTLVHVLQVAEGRTSCRYVLLTYRISRIYSQHSYVEKRIHQNQRSMACRMTTVQSSALRVHNYTVSVLLARLPLFIFKIRSHCHRKQSCFMTFHCRLCRHAAFFTCVH